MNVVQSTTAQEAADKPLVPDSDHECRRKEVLHAARTVATKQRMQGKKVDVLKEDHEENTNLIHPKSQHLQNHHARKYHHHHLLCQHQSRSNRWKSAIWN
jgi:hypothetical protein